MHNKSDPKTSQILEYGCLYTHDVRRKVKRWKDGILRFHQFNKRVMVYDIPRNFIGDSYATNRPQEGDELVLERNSTLVQVGEITSSCLTDLTALLARRAPKFVPLQAQIGTQEKRPGLSLPRSTLDAPQIRQTSSNQVYNNTSNHSEPSLTSGGQRPKRRRTCNEHVPLHEILRSTGARPRVESSATFLIEHPKTSGAKTRKTNQERALIHPTLPRKLPRIGALKANPRQWENARISPPRVEEVPPAGSVSQDRPNHETYRNRFSSSITRASLKPLIPCSKAALPDSKNILRSSEGNTYISHPLRLAGGGPQPKLICRQNIQPDRVPELEADIISELETQDGISDQDGHSKSTDTLHRSNSPLERSVHTAITNISCQPSVLMDTNPAPRCSTVSERDGQFKSLISGPSSSMHVAPANDSLPGQQPSASPGLEITQSTLVSDIQFDAALNHTLVECSLGPWTVEAWDLLGWFPPGYHNS